MTWEENPNKRNNNNVITFNIPKSVEISVGDEIFCRLSQGQKSIYEISEILNRRSSSISSFDNVTAKTNWRLG